MPFVNVKVSVEKTSKLAKEIAGIITELADRILGKSSKVISIAVEHVDPRCWFVGGVSLANRKKSSVYFDLKDVDETNTKDQKAAFIAEAYKALSDLLGDMHEESYVYIQDVRATAYAYGGKTQEYRYQS